MLFPVFTLLLITTSIHSIQAILCRTGVDSISGGLVDCSTNQCMNTTSTQATVYSCDYSGICDVLELTDKCVRDGHNWVCCCMGDNCNFGGSLSQNVHSTKRTSNASICNQREAQTSVDADQHNKPHFYVDTTSRLGKNEL